MSLLDKCMLALAVILTGTGVGLAIRPLWLNTHYWWQHQVFSRIVGYEAAEAATVFGAISFTACIFIVGFVGSFVIIKTQLRKFTHWLSFGRRGSYDD